MPASFLLLLVALQVVSFFIAEGAHELRGPIAEQDDRQRPLLFVAVCSHANNAEQRREIRASYWQDPALVGGLVEARFVVGQPRAGTATELALRQEVEMNPKDFLQLPTPDGDDRVGALYNRTAKTMLLLDWFSRYANAHFLLKLEDDAFPHFDRIIPRLRREPDALVQLGRLSRCAAVDRDGQWNHESSIWTHESYPKHMDGGGYLLSAGLIQRLAATRAFDKRQLLHLEDATLGMWLEMDRAAQPDLDVHMKEVPLTAGGCSPDDLISLRVGFGQMTCFWQRKMHGEEDICCYPHSKKEKASLLQRRASARPGARARLNAEAVSMLQMSGADNASSTRLMRGDNVSSTAHACYNSSIPDEPEAEESMLPGELDPWATTL